MEWYYILIIVLLLIIPTLGSAYRYCQQGSKPKDENPVEEVVEQEFQNVPAYVSAGVSTPYNPNYMHFDNQQNESINSAVPSAPSIGFVYYNTEIPPMASHHTINYPETSSTFVPSNSEYLSPMYPPQPQSYNQAMGGTFSTDKY